VPRRTIDSRSVPALRRRRNLFALALLSCASLTTRAAAQTLALRHYDVADGLVSSRIVCMHQDAKGYLWFGAWEGLCRFDGREFVTFGSSDGIESPVVNVIVEDSHGTLWAATNGGGIVRYRDAHATDRAKSFESFRIGDASASNVVDSILFDRAGRMWCGTEAGLFAARDPSLSPPRFELVSKSRPDWSGALIQDRSGRIWMGTPAALLEWNGTAFDAHAVPNEPALGECVAILEEEGGSFLCAFERGVQTFAPASRAGESDRWSARPLALDADQRIRAALPASNGVLWLATTKGLVKCTGGRQLRYSTSNGLTDELVYSLLEDRDHNLWIGTWSGGACTLVSESIASFTTADGLPSRNAVKLAATDDGSIVTVTGRGAVEIRGDAVSLVPGSLEPPFDRIGQRLVRDRRGDYWLGVEHAVYRCRGPRFDLRSAELFAPDDGVEHDFLFSLVGDACTGRIRVGWNDGACFTLDPASTDRPRFERSEYELPSPTGTPREWFCTHGGSVWIAPYNGLWRAKNGRVEAIDALFESALNQVRCFHQSADGKLWIGTRFHGVSMTEDPDAEHPTFRTWSSREGLASDAVWSITEDDRHRIYLGTARGLERLDPSTGRVHHTTSLEGLAGDIVYHCIADPNGFIWAATSNGVSRIDPHADEIEPAPPPVYISGIHAAGREIALPLSGSADAGTETFSADEDNLRFDYRAVSLRGERQILYQYRLDGLDADWSEATTQRSVNYGRIPPGGYRFLVRAVRADGPASLQPATFAFRIPPPFWRRSWFLASALLALGAIAFALHRARLRRVLALESIRRQIATDIHDDMGAGLSQIAILSEVAKREAPPGPARSHLGEVASLARGLRDSMSDIVWAVDPRRDHAIDLVQRMRQVAFNLFEAEGVKVELDAPPNAAIESVMLAPDRRRHLLLVFKEALSNVARHARAKEVRIEVRLSPSELALSIHDDGVGFDPTIESRGHGLSSLRTRAAALGAKLSIDSSPGRGTSIELSMPLR
jgi:signal transduction histidine kinase/ligand-binding sensor domain-containing protein